MITACLLTITTMNYCYMYWYGDGVAVQGCYLNIYHGVNAMQDKLEGW